MAIKAEDRPKLIGLLVGIVGVIAYVLVVLVPKLSATAAPAPHTDAPTTLTAASATVPAQSAAAASGDASAVVPDSDEAPIPAPPHRDSFTPPPMEGKGQLPTVPAPAAKQSAPAGPPPGPGIATGVMQPIAIQAPAPMSPPPAPALPPVELKGVILGDPSVAVLSVNGEVVQRQVGDTIVGELKLVKISDAGISIQNGKKQITVTVGHAMPGAAPMAQPAAPAAAAPVQH